MHFKALATAALGLVGSVAAQRPEGTSICDYYTTALFKNNTADNQFYLIRKIVSTALGGNYGKSSNHSLTVAFTHDSITGEKTRLANVSGILFPGTYNGIEVNLYPYFNGSLASTNRGDKPVSVNFLDAGGLGTISSHKAANSPISNQ